MPPVSAPVAIVGIGCRFPGGASGPDAFWRLLEEGVDAVSEVPADRWDVDALYDPDPSAPGRIHTRWGAFVEAVDSFDAEFFGISPREARRVDPQQRMLLEVAWEALEDAGIAPDSLAGTATGVFVGISSHDYGDMLISPARRELIDAHAPAGGAACIAANRLSHHLDLRGPSIAVDTACSSSLTALHLACLNLAAGECDLAVVGGVNLLLAPEVTIGFCRAGMLSPRGRCRPFDAGADGYVRGEGAGAVVLQPLDAARAAGAPVRALIRATSANEDGRTAGLSQPNTAAQEDLLRRVLRRAGVEPGRVGYVEAHGTGTPAGDPVEATAIGRAIGAARIPPSSCPIGSVKGNIGHLEAAAGIAGLTKAVLALQRGRIPATLHHERPSPAIDWEGLRLRVPAAGEEWPAPGDGAPRVAVVSSFGFGGANAAAVLEGDAAPGPPSPGRAADGRLRVLPLSARSPEALRALAGAWAARLGEPGAPSLADACHTAALRRAHHRHRLAVVAASPGEAADVLRAAAETGAAADAARGEAGPRPPRVAFAFTGMGPQWWGMGREIVREEPVAAAALADCDRLLRPLSGWSLREEMGADEGASRVATPALAHVANLALQVALVELWRSWGVEPDLVVGHSSGEAGAAWAAGALSLEDALALAFHRGRLQARLAGAGGMLAVDLAPEAAAAAIDGDAGRVALAAVNAPASVTLSGETAALDRIGRALRRRGVRCVALPVDVPYHGPQMEAIAADLAAALAGLRPRPPRRAMVSTVTGEAVDGAPLDASYWWRNVRSPVRFADALARAAADGVDAVVEVGPHPVLAGPIARSLTEAGNGAAAVLPSLRRDRPERRTMLRSLAELHVRGRPLDWRALDGDGRLAPMPTYPWRRERHWLEPAPAGATAAHGERDAVLGRRVPGPRPAWEIDLGDPAHAYLADHAVRGAAAFPATGYAEMALAAARALHPDGRPALEGLELRRLLTLGSQGGRVLRCSLEEDTGVVELHAAARDDPEPTWVLQARARGVPARSGALAPPPIDVEAARRRCAVPLDAQALYRRLAEDRGLVYGPAFRGLVELHRGRGEALGRLEAPEGLETDGREAHAALLDAALHVAVGALEGMGSAVPDGTILPTGIDRVESYAPLGPRVWVHAVVEAADGDARARILLADDAGTPLALLDGVRMQAPERAAPARARPLRYREEWVPVAQPPAAGPGRPPPAGRLAAAGRVAMARAAREHRVADYYSMVEPALDGEARAHARGALGEIGWRPGADPRALAVAPEHDDLLRSVVAMARAPAPEDAGAALAAARPEYRSFAGLVAESGRRLADTLRGREDAREWLFAEPAFGLLVEAYGLAPPFRAAAQALADMLAAARPGAGAGLRVVEAGAGTCGTTRAVLERAGGAVRELLVTDVSALLVRRGRELLGEAPQVRVGELDLEGPAPVGEGGFDVALAANVVHATRDLRQSLRALRRLLAPGGLLLLQESLRPADWTDLVFGQLAGWWRFADRDLRPRHTLASPGAWRRALADAGFQDVHVVAEAPPAEAPAQAVIVARARSARRGAAAARRRRAGRRWVVLADGRGVGEAVARGLSARGERPVLVRAGPALRRDRAGHHELRPERAVDWAAALRQIGAGGAPHGIVHLWGLDAPAAGGLSAGALLEAQDRLCGGLAAMVRGLRAAGWSPESLWIVTAGAQTGPGDPGSPAVAQAPLWGVGRVLRHEHGAIACRLVDLPASAPPDALAALVGELVAARGDAEEELLVRRGRVLGRRLVPEPPGPAAGDASAAPSAPARGFRLAAAVPGRLETLGLEAVEERPPGPGEVAVRVEAASLNFKDVMLALGALRWPGPGAPRLGVECVGVVEGRGPGVRAPALGDRVMAVGFGTLGSRVVTRADLTAPVPVGLPVEEAATLPGAMGSALRALRHLARVRPGERVLIHSAAGGVGLAAVQVARAAGAEVLATVSTEEKREHLRALGVRHVLDSRSLSFADQVLEATGGEGVDVVLNSLAGPALRRGLDVLRSGGRFIEMGRRDIDRDAPVGLAPFVRGLSLVSMRLASMVHGRPGELGALLRETAEGVERGELEPLPHTVFDLSDAEPAFRLMAGGRHIGRIVLEVGDAPRPVRRRREGPFRRDGTYLVMGGLGGLGLDLAGHMARRGAGRLVLAGRRGRTRPEDQPALEAVRESGADVVVARCDAARPAEVARLLGRIRASASPLRGVVHAAMVLDDAPLERVDRTRVRAAMAPKAAAAWILHALTRDDPLDLFVMLGSVAATVGPPGQAAYAGANVFLTALAEHRRSLGLPALAVDLGAVSGAGHVAGRPAVEALLARVGVLTIPPATAWRELEDALARGATRLTLADIDWDAWSRGPAATLSEAALAPLTAGDGAAAVGDALARLAAASPEEAPGLVAGHVAGIVARVLQAPAERLDRGRPLTDLGLDSLMAVEVTTAVERELGVGVSLADVLEGLSIDDLAALALRGGAALR